MPDTNPVFWRRWEELGQAVVVRAIQDYISVRKKICRLTRTEDTSHNYEAELRKYERFFQSKYFGRICPRYDGYELLEHLETGWQDIKMTKRFPKKPISEEKPYIPVANPKPRGGNKRKNNKWRRFDCRGTGRQGGA